MSKEKVDRYKQEKANRKELLEKEKKQKRMVKAGLGILAVLLIAWLGYSSYEKIYETFIMKDAEINLEAYNEYLTALNDTGEDDIDFDLEDEAAEELEDEASADETEAEVDQEPQADEAATDDASADGEQSPDEDASDDSAEE